jgi:hypothetical protein
MINIIMRTTYKTGVRKLIIKNEYEIEKRKILNDF